MFHTEYFSNAISIKDDDKYSDKDLNISGFIDNVQFTLKINNDIYIGAGVFDMSTPLLILIPSNEKTSTPFFFKQMEYLSLPFRVIIIGIS